MKDLLSPNISMSLWDVFNAAGFRRPSTVAMMANDQGTSIPSQICDHITMSGAKETKSLSSWPYQVETEMEADTLY